MSNKAAGNNFDSNGKGLCFNLGNSKRSRSQASVLACEGGRHSHWCKVHCPQTDLPAPNQNPIITVVPGDQFCPVGLGNSSGVSPPKRGENVQCHTCISPVIAANSIMKDLCRKRQFVHNIFVHNFGAPQPPPPNQQNDGFPLEFLLKGPQTKLRTLSQNCEQSLQKLRTKTEL